MDTYGFTIMRDNDAALHVLTSNACRLMSRHSIQLHRRWLDMELSVLHCTTSAQQYEWAQQHRIIGVLNTGSRLSCPCAGTETADCGTAERRNHALKSKFYMYFDTGARTECIIRACVPGGRFVKRHHRDTCKYQDLYYFHKQGNSDDIVYLSLC